MKIPDKNILFINPACLNKHTFGSKIEMLIMKKVLKIEPPLGLLYLASFLESKGYNTKIIDLAVEAKNNLYNELQKKTYQFVCLSSIYQITFKEVNLLATEIKNNYPETIIIIGGSDASIRFKDYLRNKNIDIVVIGEGENTLLNIVKHFHKVNKIPGIAYRKVNKIINNGYPQRIANLDILPSPNFDKINLNNYGFPFYFSKKNRVLPIISSRGCPYNCSFCLKSVFGKSVTFRSVNNIIQEIKTNVKKYKISDYCFLDDTFTLNKKRILEFCQKVKYLKIHYQIITRLDCMDLELLKELKASGCYLIEYGIESGSDKILKKMNRSILPKNHLSILKATAKLGILVKANFIHNFPGETKTDLKKSLKIAQDDSIYIAKFARYINYYQKSKSSRWDSLNNFAIIKFYFIFFLNPKRIINFLKQIKSPDNVFTMLVFFAYLTLKLIFLIFKKLLGLFPNKNAARA